MGSYALTQVGLGLIGDKGLSKVSKVATTANLTKGMSRVTNSVTYRNTLNVFNNYTGNLKVILHLQVEHSNIYKKQLIIPMKARMVKNNQVKNG